MVMWAHQPEYPELRCVKCGVVKAHWDKNDDLLFDKSLTYVKGTWFFPNGHANVVEE